MQSLGARRSAVMSALRLVAAGLLVTVAWATTPEVGSVGNNINIGVGKGKDISWVAPSFSGDPPCLHALSPAGLWR